MGMFDTSLQRSITPGERKILFGVFKLSLEYDDLRVDVNAMNLGGTTNSITPLDTPYFSRTIWTSDFSNSSHDDQWIFVHEFSHVWQWATGMNKAIQLAILSAATKDYEDAYPYRLESASNFSAFNMEQQASIIADFFFKTKGLSPQKNRGKATLLNDYYPFMNQVWAKKASDAGILDKITRAIPFL